MSNLRIASALAAIAALGSSLGPVVRIEREPEREWPDKDAGGGAVFLSRSVGLFSVAGAATRHLVGAAAPTTGLRRQVIPRVGGRARSAAPREPPPERSASKGWLIKRGYTSMDDGDVPLPPGEAAR